MESNAIDALVQQLCELRVLEPDAEAEACGEAFDGFVRDRMDEWHAALDAFDARGTDSLQREVFVTRSAKELADRVAASPVGPRTIEFARAYRGSTGYDTADVRSIAAVNTLRELWEPAFHRSERWRQTTALFCQSWPVPWVVLACRALVRETRAVGLEKPSPLAPWIALWARGVWATPYGEGGVGVWVPSVDRGPAGIIAALEEIPVNDWAVSELMALGFMAPRSMKGPGCHGVVYFGAGQTDNIDPAPALWLAPPMPIGPPPNMPMQIRPPTPNLPVPTFNPMLVPTPPTNLPMNPPPMQTPDAPSGEQKQKQEAESSSEGVLDRLRRWWKK